MNTPLQTKQQRSIYDAGYGEIFWKSLLAGFSLGLGKTLASLIFYAVILALFATYAAPFLDRFMEPIDRLIPILEQTNRQSQGVDDQINALFSTFQRPAAVTAQPEPTTIPAGSPTQTDSAF